MKTIRLLAITFLAMVSFVFTSLAQLQTAGNVLVNLDFTTNALGQFMFVTNNGTLGGVFEINNTITNEFPFVVQVNGGTKAMMLDGRQALEHLASFAITNGVTTNPAVAISAPSQITGTNPPVSIEVWAYNPTVGPREDMVSWGRTGGTNSLMDFSFGYGTGSGAGAVDRNATGANPGPTALIAPSDYDLAGPNLSWGTSIPSAGAWHHLVYTFSGAGKVDKLYLDGVRVVTWTNYQDVVTWAGTNITIGRSRGGGGLNGIANGANASMAIARIRIMDGVLTDANVLNNYNFERPNFTSSITTALSGGPLHRWQFNQPATNDAVGVTVPDTGSSGTATGTIQGVVGVNGAAFDGTKLLTGGGAATGTYSPAYVDLPNGILSSLSVSNTNGPAGPGQVTFEGWMTLSNGYTWASFFSFGNTSTGEKTTPNTNNAGYGGVAYINWGYNVNNSSTVHRFEITGGGVNTHDLSIDSVDTLPVSIEHWAVTWDEPSKLVNLYINGQLISQAVAPGTSLFTNVQDVNNWLGRDNWNGDQYMSMQYREFRMYDRVLSPGEIATDYAYGPNGVWTNLSDVGSLAGVTVQTPDTNYWVGGGFPLDVRATYTGTGAWQREIAGDPNIAYTTSASGVATVTSNGLVRLVGAGPVTIAAIFGGMSNTVSFSVSNQTAALIHRYSFNDGDLSTTAADSVGGATGTFTNTFVVTNSAQLGSGGYVIFPTNLITGYGALTVEAWVSSYTNAANNCFWSFGDQNPQTGAGRNGIMFAERNGGRTFAFPGSDLGAAHEQSAGRIINLAQSSLITGPGNTAVGVDNLENVHVVGVYNPDLGIVQMFYNGQLQAQAAGYRPLSGIVDNLNYLGHSLYSADPLYNGAVAEFRIWSGALTPQQIAINTAAGPDSLVASPGALNTVSWTVPFTNIVKSVNEQTTFIGNFANVSGVNLVNYGGTNTVFTSDASNIVAISQLGTITGIAQGTGHVVASFGGKSVTNTITVADPAPVLAHRYTFNTNADDVVGGANGFFAGGANTNGLGQVVLSSTTADYIQLPAGIISNYFAVTIEAFVTSFGTNTPGAWLWGFGEEDPGTLFGHDYTYFSPHVGANARAGISTAQIPGTGAEQNVTIANGQMDNQTNLVICVVQHPFLNFEQIYINGVLIATNTITTLLSQVGPDFNYIGRSLYDNPTGAYPAQAYMNATIDDFRIYNGVLGVSQIAVDAAAGGNNIVTNVGAFSSITITVPTNQLRVTDSETVIVGGNFANVTNVNLFTYTNLGAVTMTSGDSNVFVVGSNGLVTAVAAGTANLITTVSNVSATNRLTVIGSRAFTLKHRWSFNDGTPNDSAGGANGTLAGTASISGGSLVLTGGANGTGYLQLPAGIVSSMTNCTWEVWCKRTAVAGWGRIFDFGSNTGGTNATGTGTTYAFLTPDSAGGAAPPRFAFTTNSNGAENPILTAGAQVLDGVTNVYSVVFDFTKNFSALYINGNQSATGVTPLPLSGLQDYNNWMGRSQWAGDPDLNGTIDEFRMWEGRLLPGEVAQSVTNGPNSLPVPSLSTSNGVGTTTFIWPYAFQRYTLQTNSSLTTTNWVAITNNPVTTNGLRRVTLPTPVSGSTFYRLSSYTSGQ